MIILIKSFKNFFREIDFTGKIPFREINFFKKKILEIDFTKEVVIKIRQ